MIRKVVASVLGLVLAASLTACDPPMPPSVLAQLSEQTYTCVEGSALVYSPAEMSDAVTALQDSLAAACIDPLPAMTMESADEANSDIELTLSPEKISNAFLTLPFATETADLAFSLDVSTSLNLSAKTAAGILNGSISNWDDPAIVSENPDIEMPAEPIVLRTSADSLAFASLGAWLKHLGSPITANFELTQDSTSAEPLSEGEVAIIPHSQNQTLGGSAASIIVGKHKGEPLIANADTDGIIAATTQWVSQKTKSGISVSIDYKKPVTIPDGSSSAATPYQAIYPVYAVLKGKNSLLKRAVVTFLLRLDSQGSLGASVYSPIDENTRVNAVAMARVGLPPVKFPKK